MCGVELSLFNEYKCKIIDSYVPSLGITRIASRLETVALESQIVRMWELALNQRIMAHESICKIRMEIRVDRTP